MTSTASKAPAPSAGDDISRFSLRSLGRAAIGFAPANADATLPEATGRAAFTAVRLGLLGAVALFPAYALIFMSAAIRDTLSVGPGTLNVVLLATPLSTASLSFAIAARWSHSRPRALTLAALAAPFALALSSFSSSIKVLLLVSIVSGVAAAGAAAMHGSVIADSTPVHERLSGFVAYRAIEACGPALVMGLLVTLTAMNDLTWRTVLLVLSVFGGFSLLLIRGVGVTPLGRWDTDRVVDAVVANTGSATVDVDEEPLRTFEAARRATGIATVKSILGAQALLGLLSLPVTGYVLFMLGERFGLSLATRGLVYVVSVVIGAATCAAVVPRAQQTWQQRPSDLVKSGASAVAVGLLALLLAGAVPVLAISVLGLCLSAIGMLVIRPILDLTLMTVTPPALRPIAGSLAGTTYWVGAALGGIFIFGGLDRSFGPGGVLVAAAIIGAQVLPVLRLIARQLEADVDKLVDQVVESTELRQSLKRGEHVPMLACRGIDFSYGQLQVLFGVDFTVDDGEMVALLGTNGAGKSTLLRVISGLGLPSTGSVRLRGEDVTYVDTERRMRMGISQVPGGKGVYPPMTVLENLRVIGYSCGRDRAAVERGIEESFAAFPRLEERKRQLASTLSGGEQQMLSLARALIVRPQLLLIDELSLGLAPKIVGELLESVRRINAAGTAVVLVEQSVNVALSLVDHAYFMEKGEMRFDGSSKDLLARPDLLRSVFLHGAAGEVKARGSAGAARKVKAQSGRGQAS